MPKNVVCNYTEATPSYWSEMTHAKVGAMRTGGGRAGGEPEFTFIASSPEMSSDKSVPVVLFEEKRGFKERKKETPHLECGGKTRFQSR